MLVAPTFEAALVRIRGEYPNVFLGLNLAKLCNQARSLVNANLFYMNFIDTHFQQVSIPNLTRTMKQKFLN